MSDLLPVKRHTDEDLEVVETKAQLIGMAQGAGGVIALMLLWKLLGWLPALLVLAGGGWLLWKLLGPSGKDDASEAE